MAKRPGGRPHNVNPDGADHAERVYSREYRRALDSGMSDRAARGAALDAKGDQARERAALDFDANYPGLLERVLADRPTPEEAAREPGRVPKRYDDDRERARKLLDQRRKRAEHEYIEAYAAEHDRKAAEAADPSTRAYHERYAREWRESEHVAPRPTDPSTAALMTASMRTLSVLNLPGGELLRRLLDLAVDLVPEGVPTYLQALETVGDEGSPAFNRAARRVSEIVIRALQATKHPAKPI
jgi:hypothetical protein